MRQILLLTLAWLAMSATAAPLETIPEFRTMSKGDQRELTCLALNVYHEARGSSTLDQIGTAQVVFNVLKARPNLISVCRTVYDQILVDGRWVGRFSWTSDKLSDAVPDTKAWEASQRVAYMVYTDDELPDYTAGATHYHEKSILPYWAKGGINKIRLGSHIYMTLPDYQPFQYISTR